jgi:pimeloyl-ACP methyl ester carboxylesterase
MTMPIPAKAFAAALALAIPAAPAYAVSLQQPRPEVEIGYLPAGPDLTLRRLVVRNPDAKGQVLLLHGFPETLYAWADVANALGDEFEVHAFDWPGYGLSSRPPADRFGYAPADYARVLRAYIDKAGLDRSKLTIYATDIGALPALLAALDEPGLARTIVVGDFAPFDRPALMHERLQRLKTEPAATQARADLNATRDDILENAFRRGLPAAAQFEVSQAFRNDMARGWDTGGLTSADAFYHYYSHFTRDQQRFEADVAKLRTPLKVVWGGQDIYIDKAMGAELADKTGVSLTVLPGVGHYPHLQVPAQTVAEIRAAAR